MVRQPRVTVPLSLLPTHEPTPMPGLSRGPENLRNSESS